MASTALATNIVTTLRDRGPLPVDYLAKMYGRQPSELRDYIEELKGRNLVTIRVSDTEGEIVALTSKR